MIARFLMVAVSTVAMVFVTHAENNNSEKEGDLMEMVSAQKTNEQLPEGSFYNLKVKSLDGKKVDLSDYAGKVVLVVNVASKCGFTKQYAGLQKLYEKLKDRGFVILGFPSNDFGGQEPGTAEQIREFCTTNYGVTFPMFAKLQTKKGEGQSPVYENLQRQSGKLPRWNFGKYLIGKDGLVIEYYGSRVKPDSEKLRNAIDEALKK